MADEDDEWEENLEAIEALEGSGLELEEISWEELMKHNTVGDMWVSIVSVRPAWRCATLLPPPPPPALHPCHHNSRRKFPRHCAVCISLTATAAAAAAAAAARTTWSST
jgi:hypothetical protein